MDGPKGPHQGRAAGTNEASQPTPTLTLFCGRCWHDQGRKIPLTLVVANRKWPGPRLTAERVTLFCPYCGVERQNGGTHLRVREIPGGTGEETIIRIPHVIAA